jgi:hypothetical protein
VRLKFLRLIKVVHTPLTLETCIDRGATLWRQILKENSSSLQSLLHLMVQIKDITEHMKLHEALLEKSTYMPWSIICMEGEPFNDALRRSLKKGRRAEMSIKSGKPLKSIP